MTEKIIYERKAVRFNDNWDVLPAITYSESKQIEGKVAEWRDTKTVGLTLRITPGKVVWYTLSACRDRCRHAGDCADGDANMELDDHQKGAVEALDRQFDEGARDLSFGAPIGTGAHLVVAAYAALRAGRGERCLVLHPMPWMRIDDFRRCVPGVDVGSIGSGAMVEVGSYSQAHRRFVAIRKALAGFPVLLVDLAAPACGPMPGGEAVPDLLRGP